MKRFALLRPARLVPDEYRANFIHLYFDVAWFGLLVGSALAFVAVYATRQGASGFQIGLLTAGPALVNLIFTLPAGRWLEKQPLSGAVFWSAIFSRIFYGVWVLLPILLAPHVQIWALIGLTLLMSVPGTAILVGFNALFAEAVPTEWRGDVAGARNAVIAIAVIVSSLVCGQILNRVVFPLNYQIVFGLGFVGAMMSAFHLWFVRPVSGRLAAPHAEHSQGDRPPIGIGLRAIRSRGLRLIRADVLTGQFGSMVAVLFAFHLSQYLPIPLFPLYWVDELHLSDQVIGIGTAIFHGTFFLGSTQLGYLTQRLGNHKLMVFGIIGLSTYPTLMGLSRGVELFLVASFIGGTGWSMAGGALNNYILERVPPDDRPAHLAWYNLALNAAILLASLTGPIVAGQIGLSAALILFGASRLLAALAILRWGS